MLGVEAYYVNGPFSSGTEYYFNWVRVDARHTIRSFMVATSFVAYMFTGETHPYSDKAGYFEMVSPKKSVFERWPGCVGARGTLLLRRFRLGARSGAAEVLPRHPAHQLVRTNDVIRLEAAYGYSMLDRFDLTGRHPVLPDARPARDQVAP